MKYFLSLCFFLLSFSCSAGVTEWIGFNLDGGHVKIPVTIAGIETNAILDTGSQVNAINKAFVNKNELTFGKSSKINIKGAFETSKANRYNNVPINLFGLETELNRVVELRLGHHSNGLLLGSAFFNNFVTQLDYPNQKMRLINHDSIDLAKLENIEVQSQKVTGMPIVKVGVGNDRFLWLLLDTGNSGGLMIKRKIAENMGWLDNLDTDTSIAFGANAMSTTENFRIPLLKFGPFSLENVLVNVPAEGESSNLENQYSDYGSKIKGKKVQGIIGYDVLKHFLITIDYKGGHAHISLPES